MYAMKTVKKNPKIHKYAYTEKDILVKIRHVSYRTLVERNNQEYLPNPSCRVNHHEQPPSLQHYLALCTKNLAFYSLETCQNMRFIVEKRQAAGTPTELN
jgi:hypothetical protein